MIEKYLNKVHCGDCLEFMKGLPSNSIDAIITDPPYELGFMAKKWDNTGIAYNIDLWRQCLRVLKAGGHLLAFGGTRTYHRMACAIEDAGFEIRDQLQWLYGSGFPKSLNISKKIDQKQGIKHPINKPISNNIAMNIKSNLAKQWDGWGSALKPAHEPICMARKPIEAKTIADNVLKYGTGGINIDASRISYENGGTVATNPKLRVAKGCKTETGDRIFCQGKLGKKNTMVENVKTGGRFPSNVILSHHPDCKEIGVKEVGNGELKKTGFRIGGNSQHTFGLNGKKNSPDNYGKETVPHYECHPDCPIGMLDKQSGVSKSIFADRGRGFSSKGSNEGYKRKSHDNPNYQNNLGGFNDTGTASRFFYCAKSSRAERNKGCENLEIKQTKGGGGGIGDYKNDVNSMSGKYGSEKAPANNHHPTVKPIKLMQYLIKLITPPNGIVLDCFAGSGSTLIACKSLGFDFIGIEKELEYCNIANERIKAEQPQLKLNLG